MIQRRNQREKCFEMDKVEDNILKNLCSAVKALLGGELLCTNVCINRKKKVE